MNSNLSRIQMDSETAQPEQAIRSLGGPRLATVTLIACAGGGPGRQGSSGPWHTLVDS
jgi:hypothetical protein